MHAQLVTYSHMRDRAGNEREASPMTITVEIRQVYGQDTVYPADDLARTFTKLTGHKTFTPRDLAAIRELGYEVKEAVRPEWIYGK